MGAQKRPLWHVGDMCMLLLPLLNTSLANGAHIREPVVCDRMLAADCDFMLLPVTRSIMHGSVGSSFPTTATWALVAHDNLNSQ